MRFAERKCQYCHDTISAVAIVKHEAMCKEQTPEERKLSKERRDYQRRFHGYLGTPVTVGKRYKAAASNGKGKRVSVTVSIDYQKLLTLVAELLPGVTLDKVGLE